MTKLLVNASLWICTLSLCYVLGNMFFSPQNFLLAGSESLVNDSQLVAQRYESPDEDLVALLGGMGVEFKSSVSLPSRLQIFVEQGLATNCPLNEFDSSGKCFGLLEYTDGGYAIVGGYHPQVDGANYFQLVRIGAGADLVTRETMIRDGAKSIWLLNAMPSNRFKSGALAVVFDTPWINLGIDDGSDESRSEFVEDEKTGQLIKSSNLVLKNEGTETVYLDKTISSCGCLVVSDKSRVSIAPGKNHIVELKANLGGKNKYSHNVVFLLSNDGNEKLAAKFDVFGNRLLDVRSLLANSAYLGDFRPDQTREFSFSMFESMENRFEILDVEMGGAVFYDHQVKTSVMPDGLNRYDFTLIPHSFGALKEAFGHTQPLIGKLRIKTTSASQNSVALDVIGRLVIDEGSQSELVALGQVQKDVGYQVEIPGIPESDASTIEEVRIDKESLGVVEVTVDHDSLNRGAVSVTFRKSGIVELPVTCVIKTDSGQTSTVDVLLSAFVSAEKNSFFP